MQCNMRRPAPAFCDCTQRPLTSSITVFPLLLSRFPLRFLTRCQCYSINQIHFQTLRIDSKNLIQSSSQNVKHLRNVWSATCCLSKQLLTRRAPSNRLEFTLQLSGGARFGANCFLLLSSTIWPFCFSVYCAPKVSNRKSNIVEPAFWLSSLHLPSIYFSSPRVIQGE